MCRLILMLDGGWLLLLSIVWLEVGSTLSFHLKAVLVVEITKDYVLNAVPNFDADRVELLLHIAQVRLGLVGQIFSQVVHSLREIHAELTFELESNCAPFFEIGLPLGCAGETFAVCKVAKRFFGQVKFTREVRFVFFTDRHEF